MTAQYNIQFADPLGVLIGPIQTTDGTMGDPNAVSSLSYSRVTNDVGVAVLRYPGQLSNRLLRVDNLVLIYRTLDGTTSLITETAWFVRSWRFVLDGSGQRMTEVIAYSGNYLLSGRGVPYQVGLPQSNKAGAADNVIKALVRENLGSSAADAARIVPNLTIQSNTTQGATVEVEAAWRSSVLTVAQELADASTDAGTYIAFDIVTTTPGQWEFRTYAGQRNVDRRIPDGTLPLLLGVDYGNLVDVEYRVDYSETGTAVYALGGGAFDRRTVRLAKNNAAIALSPYNLRELYIDASNAANGNQVQSAAQAAVRRERPRVTMQGRIVETPNTRYGVNWNWGDYVTTNVFGTTLNARIDAISVTVENGLETINAWVRSD